LYPSFVHIDVRPSKMLARWHGGRLDAEVLNRGLNKGVKP
jgi:hypothetical protein